MIYKEDTQHEEDLLDKAKQQEKDSANKQYKKVLTKSNYLLGLQCPKLLWVKVHDKTRIPEPDEFDKKRFSVGDEIEQLMKTLFPEGIAIPHEDFKENLRLSKELLEKRVPLFEPAFKIGQLYSRADVLVPVGTNEWDIVEMKSATKVKDVNLHDVSFQKYIYEKVGLHIRKCYVMHINRDYVRRGELNAKEFFTQTDVTEQVRHLSEHIEERIETMLRVINNETEPSYELGEHCSSPYSCPLKKECWVDLPNGNKIGYYMNEPLQAFEIHKKGFIFLDKIPDYYNKGKNPFAKYLHAKNKGETFTKTLVETFTKELEYPLYYLHIDSIHPAIPAFESTSPYKPSPYGFSLHIQNSPYGSLEHVGFLADGTRDPRYLMMKILRETIGIDGSILVHDKHHIRNILKSIAWRYKEFREFTESLIARIHDLWEVFEPLHFFDLEGNFTSPIHYSLPGHGPLRHEDIQRNTMRHRALLYEETIHNNKKEQDTSKIKKQLRNEMRKDTLALVRILDALQEIRKDNL